MHLPDGEGHLWVAPIEDEDSQASERWIEWLSENERKRYEGIVLPGAKTQFAAGRALLKSLLSEYCQIHPRECVIRPDHLGRPFLEFPTGFEAFDFNLSHTGGMVVCMIARNCRLGVDVENVQRRLEYPTLAPLFLSAEEQARISRLQPAERDQSLIETWVTKEAYAKARGLGLRLPLTGLMCDFTNKVPEVIFSEGFEPDPPSWCFWRFDQYGFKIAVAASSNPPLSRVIVKERCLSQASI
ncbi:4'-phosphopantetheinyl transferase family protein [Parerythrobacter aestuarii]|uniref:4'-phosphopantetheinyl transferase family protein n=1 Tax=Parerythrobacter aestuarii TaxID=3020909 RepID=UPI0024DE4A9B|nr:4'-phosphopantetheinyl transferase superfamily protein [Parerythrobacter aestuarii]